MNLQRLIITFLCFSCINFEFFAQASEILSKVHPYISLREEYSDNLNQTSTNEKEDFYTTIQPGIIFSSTDEMASVDLDYSIGAVFYSRYSDLNYISHDASLSAKYVTAEHINFYLRESFIRSDDPQEREYFTLTEDNKYVLTTQTKRGIYWRNVVAPAVEYQFGPEARLGIAYRNNLYRTERESGQDSEENYISPSISYWFDNRNGIALEYGFTLGNFETNPDLNGHRINARVTHRFGTTSSAYVEYNYYRRTFETPGVDYDVHDPAVGISHALTPTLNATVQVGYFWKRSDYGSEKEGWSYKGELKSAEPRTAFELSFQGGYTEDFFTSENLGFNRYYRLIGSLTYLLDKQMALGGFASIERADYDQPEHRDTIWKVGARSSYVLLKWLTLAFEVSHSDRQSDVSFYEFKDNRGMLTITALYQ